MKMRELNKTNSSESDSDVDNDSGSENINEMDMEVTKIKEEPVEEEEEENKNSDNDNGERMETGENGDDDEDDDDKKEVVKAQNGGKYVKAMKKQPKPGIIYLSKIPPKMNVKMVREYFSKFGELNRSFLQPEKKPWKGKGKPKNQTFTEGWIEFKKKRHAKKVAEMLNNQPVGGKKTKEYHDFLWNIKYLRGFLWVHLNERLAYERISQQHKVRAEISAAKRETAFFAKNVELSRKLKKKGLLSNNQSST